MAERISVVGSLPSDFQSAFKQRCEQLSSNISSELNPSSVSVEGLLDTFIALHTDCKLAHNQSPHTLGFVKKYDRFVSRLQSWRVNRNDFDVLQTLATGAVGKVCLVRSKLDKLVYAMKILKKTDLLTRREAAFFMEERNALVFAQQSKWMTTLYSAFQDDENLYLVMEYVSGGSVRNMLDSREEDMSEDETRFYMAEMMIALDELHKLSFIHRDVKPENYLIDATGHIKLADFGSCMRMNESRMVNSTETVGTPDYISPEILRAQEGNVSYGRECDWWSLGIIMYEFLFGDVPFYSESLSKTYSRIMNHEKEFAFPEDCEVSEEARDLMQKLICKREVRLGREGSHDIRAHPWFQSVQFDGIRNSKPPFVPELSGPDDTRYFENEEDESKKVPIKPAAKTKEFQGQSLPFVGYTYLQNYTPTVNWGNTTQSTSNGYLNPRGSVVSYRMRSSSNCSNDGIDDFRAKWQQEAQKVVGLIKSKEQADTEVANLRHKIVKETAEKTQLQSTISALQQEKLSMEADRKASQLEKEHDRHELEELKTKIADLKRSLETKVAECIHLTQVQEDKIALELQVSTLRAEIQQFSLSKHEQDVSNSELSRLKSGLENEIASLKRKLQASEAELTESIEKTATLKKSLEDVESQRDQGKLELEHKRDDVHMLEQKLSTLQEQLAQDQEKTQALALTLSNTEKTKAVVEIELDHLKEARAESAAREAELTTRLARYEEYQQRFEKTAQEMDDLRKQLDRALESKTKLTTEYERILKKCALLEIELKEGRRAQVADLTEKLTSESQKIQELDNTVSKLEKEKAVQAVELEAVTKKLQDAEAECIRSQHTAEELEQLKTTQIALLGENETLKKQAEVAKEARAKVSEELAHKLKQWAVLEIELREKKRLLINESETHAQTRTALGESQKRLELQGSRISTLQEYSKKLEEQVAKLTPEIAELQKSLSAQMAALDSERLRREDQEKLQSALEIKLQESNLRYAQATQSLKKSEESSKELQQALTEERKLRLNFESLYKRAETVSAGLQEELERMVARISTIKEEHTKSIRSHQEVEASLQAKIGNLEVMIQEKGAQIHQIELQSQEKDHEISRLKAESEQLEADSKDVQTALQEELDVSVARELELRSHYEIECARSNTMSERLEELERTAAIQATHLEDMSKRLAKYAESSKLEAGTKTPTRLKIKNALFGGKSNSSLTPTRMTPEEDERHMRRVSAESTHSLKSGLTKTSDTPYSNPGEDLRGQLKIPKQGKVRKGWRVVYAVIKDMRLYTYEKEKDTETKEGTFVVDIRSAMFVVSSVTQNELIHASARDIDCIFKIQASNTSSKEKEHPAASVTPFNAAEVTKKVTKLQADIMLEEKMLHAAEKLLHATADANKMQALNQVEAANKRLKILRIELERHVGFLSSTSGNPDEVTAQTPVAQSMGTTPSLSMLVSTESSTALAECAHLTHEQLDEVEQYRQELEDQIEIEMKKRDLLVKGSNTIFEKKKSTKDIDMEIAMCDRLLHRWKDEIKIIVTGDADKIASLYHRVIQKNECNGHWFKVKQYECPTDCSYCHEPLWGAKSEGLECTVCKAICHKACKNLISVSCQDILELQNIPPMYFMANDPQEKARWVAGLTHLRNECEDENSGGQAGHSDTPLRSGAGSLSSLVMLYDKMAKDNISSNAKPLAGARSGSGYLLSTAAGSATPTAGYDSPKTPGTPTTLSRMGSVLSTSGREKSKSQTIWGRG